MAFDFYNDENELDLEINLLTDKVNSILKDNIFKDFAIRDITKLKIRYAKQDILNSTKDKRIFCFSLKEMFMHKTVHSTFDVNTGFLLVYFDILYLMILKYIRAKDKKEFQPSKDTIGLKEFIFSVPQLSLGIYSRVLNHHKAELLQVFEYFFDKIKAKEDIIPFDEIYIKEMAYKNIIEIYESDKTSKKTTTYVRNNLNMPLMKYLNLIYKHVYEKIKNFKDEPEEPLEFPF